MAISYEYASSFGADAHWLAERGMTSRVIFVALLPGPSDYFHCTPGPHCSILSCLPSWSVKAMVPSWSAEMDCMRKMGGGLLSRSPTLSNVFWDILVGRDGFRHSRQTRKHKSRIPCPMFGESRFRETVKSRIPSIYLSFSRFPHRILVKSRIPKIPFQTLGYG